VGIQSHIALLKLEQAVKFVTTVLKSGGIIFDKSSLGRGTFLRSRWRNYLK